jgi:cell division septal protein FtsQ
MKNDWSIPLLIILALVLWLGGGYVIVTSITKTVPQAIVMSSQQSLSEDQ